MRFIYDKMWKNALEAFENDKFEFDTYIEDPNDNRRGITLYAKPDTSILRAFDKFIVEARKIEPYQYFYQIDEIHFNCIIYY